MKLQTLSFFAGTLLLLSGCGDDDDSGNQAATPQSGLTAKVDGADWASATTNYALSNDQVQFSGRNAAGDIIELFMVQPTGPVTYSSSNPDTYLLARYESASGAEWKSNMPGASATITVNSFDQTTKVGSGTFSFTAPASNTAAQGTKTITNGTFTNIKLAF